MRAEKHSLRNAIRAVVCIALAAALAFIFAKTDLPTLAWGIASQFAKYAYNDMAHNNSEGLLNQIVGIGIFVGAIFAGWRIRAMNRQATAAEGGHCQNDVFSMRTGCQVRPAGILDAPSESLSEFSYRALPNN